MIPSLLAALALAALPARATDPDPDPGSGGPSATAQSQFALLKARMLAKQGVPIAAAGVTLPPPPPPAGAPAGAPPPPPQDWKHAEAERRVEFDRQFGGGSYDNIINFSNHCVPPACNFLATADIIRGAYDYVDLRRDVEAKKLEEGTAAYAQRDGQIKSGMRQTLDEMRPIPGGDPAKQEELIRVSDPIVKRVFTADELLQYARRNAETADSAPYYAFLGRTLNGAGQPGPARAAFDAALARDPRYEPAFSGRADSAYKLGDYSAAVKDARAALTLNPADAAALTTLKFSEGRVPVAAAGGDAGARSAAPAGAETPGPAAALGGLLPPGPPQSQRVNALLQEARRALGLGDARAAAAAARRALELDPANAHAYSLAAVAAIRLKDYPAALAAAQAGLKLSPNNAALYDAKAFALNATKDYRGALEASDRALALDIKDPYAYFDRAAALRGLGDRAGMAAALDSAARVDPRFAAIRDAALRLPQDADIMYLFPGDSPAPEPAAPPSAPSPAPPWLLVGGGVLGGGVLALLGAAALRRRDPAPPPLSSVRRRPSLLAGKYELGRPLGSGGMGVVYEGFDRSLQRPVAVKRLREELRQDPKEAARFLSEAKMVARLKHPNIVEVYAAVEEDGELFVVFERVDGTTLHERLARETRLAFGPGRDLFRGVLAALDEAHRRAVIHRDLKPSNIMIDAQGRPRVTDFGIARLAEEVLSRRTRTVSGTPSYMAPEQEQGVARRESDLYAAAVCLYETFTGKLPFGGVGPGMLMNKLKAAYEPASRRAAGLPGGLDAFFARALDPDPEKRYPTATELLRALESVDA